MEGLSGTGKSSVYDELVRRGYAAVSTDRAWSYSADPDTGLPGGPVGHATWMWDRQRAIGAQVVDELLRLAGVVAEGGNG